MPLHHSGSRDINHALAHAAVETMAMGLVRTRTAILVGIDKFMSECRALTNLIGNGVATIVISRMEGELDGIGRAMPWLILSWPAKSTTGRWARSVWPDHKLFVALYQ